MIQNCKPSLGLFERPFILIENGEPTHLFAATGIGSSKYWFPDTTWNVVLPIN